MRPLELLGRSALVSSGRRRSANPPSATTSEALNTRDQVRDVLDVCYLSFEAKSSQIGVLLEPS